MAAEKAASLIPVRLVSINVHEALELAIENKIYAYDAYFLHCAKSLSQPLMSLDKKIKQIARDIGVDLVE